MQVTSHVALSGQLALARRLDTIANNVANAATAGYRAEGISFNALVSHTEPVSTSFSTSGSPHVDLGSGAFTRTGNPLDIAIQGTGFLGIATPQGTAYTRDGRLQMLPGGEIVSITGHPVVDTGGSPLAVDPLGGTLNIGRDGSIRQDGRTVGTLGLFAVDLDAGYTRYENAGFFPTVPATPLEEGSTAGVVQGFTEGSNVNPILEMTHLIRVQRAFDAVTASLEQRDQSMRDTIQALGARSS